MVKNSRNESAKDNFDFTQKIEVTVSAEDKAAAEAEAKRSEQIRMWLRAHLPELDKFRNIKEKELRKLKKPQRNKILDGIKAAQDSMSILCRQTAWTEGLKYAFESSAAQNLREALIAMGRLVRDGWLDDSTPKDADLRGFGQGWKIPNKATFEKEHFVETQKAMARFVKRISQNEVTARIERFQEQLLMDNQLGVEDLLGGQEDGQGMVYIPTQIHQEKGVLKQWVGGFLVASTTKDGKIFPEDAFGYFDHANGVDYFSEHIAEMKSVRTYVLASSLDEGNAPWLKKSTPPENRKRQRLWHSLKRLKDRFHETEKNGAAVELETQKLQERATVSQAEWLLDGVDGVALVDYQGLVILDATEDNKEEKKPTRRTRTWDISMLVERKKGRIKFLELPERVRPLFKGLKDEYEDREKFYGVEHPLARCILQACYAEQQIKSLQNA